MACASFLAKKGWSVTVVEQHDMPGGRARRFSQDGFTFDMGPSWYWMPDVFENYFACFGKKVSDYYDLIRLDPSYRVYWENEQMDIAADYAALRNMFESVEAGAATKLDQFMEEAAYKYKVGINKLVYKPGRSFTEFLDLDLAKGLLKLDVFTSVQKHVGKYFTHPHLRQLLEFPVLFLGALPKDIPALYTLMNYADVKLGTWYPQGGMYKIVQAMHSLAAELGVQFHFNTKATKIPVSAKTAKGVTISCGGQEQLLEADVVIGAADYHFVEQQLLEPDQRTYSQKYWHGRVMAPSCLLYYVGINKKLKNVLHHSLFFDVDFARHGKEIYETEQWPAEPLFYVSATSVTDPEAAPVGCENLFFLIPVASGLQHDNDALRDTYFEQIAERFEQRIGEKIRDNIVFKRSFGVQDFVNEYNAFKGNAYGLANTLLQTAILKPSLKSSKVENLYFTGQLTVPGPGVPPSLISGEVVAAEINKAYNN